jgi:hypothetical protein
MTWAPLAHLLQHAERVIAVDDDSIVRPARYSPV